MTTKQSLLMPLDLESGPEPLIEALHTMFIEYCRSEVNFTPEQRRDLSFKYETIRDILNKVFVFAEDEDRNNFENQIGL